MRKVSQRGICASKCWTYFQANDPRTSYARRCNVRIAAAVHLFIPGNCSFLPASTWLIILSKLAAEISLCPRIGSWE